MENILTGIDDSDVVIDDIGAFSTSWESHIELLQAIPWHLRDNGFNGMDHQRNRLLGHWLTLHGLKLWKMKIDVILHMKHPEPSTDLCLHVTKPRTCPEAHNWFFGYGKGITQQIFLVQ